MLDANKAFDKGTPKPSNDTYGAGKVGSQVPLGGSGYDKFVSPRLLDEGRLDDMRAESQGALEAWGNALPRFVGLTASNVAQTIPLLIGAAMGIGGEVSDLATGRDDNTFMDSLDNSAVKAFDEMNQNLKDKFAIYKSDETQNAGFGSVGSSEFLAELFSDGGSFAASAWLTGAGISKLIGGGAKLGKAILQTANSLNPEEVIGAIKGYSALEAGIYNGGRKLAAGTLGAMTEAGIEAIGQRDTMRENLANEQRTKNFAATGYEELTPEQQADIEERANKAGNASFLANLAIVSTGNLLEFGKYFGNYSDDAVKMGQHFRGEAGEGLLKNYTKEEMKQATSWYGKLFQGVKNNIGKLADPLTEGLEESAQTGVGKYLEEYYGTDKSSMGNFVESFSRAMGGMTDKDGIQSFLSGALIGGAISISKGVASKFSKEPSEQAKQEQALTDLNSMNLSKSVKDMADGLAKNRFNNNVIDGALLEQDEVSYNVLKTNQFVQDVVTASKYGKLDDVIESIKEFAEAPIDEIKQMMKSDLSLDDSKDDYKVEDVGKIDRQKLAKEMIDQAKAISKEYQSVKRKFGAVYNDDELGFVASLNANKDMLIRNRDAMVQILGDKGFDYTKDIQKQLVNPKRLDELELQDSNLRKLQAETENKIGKLGKLTNDEKIAHVDFQAHSKELESITNQRNDLLRQIDANIMVGDNENDSDDFKNRVNALFNKAINATEFETERKAGEPLDVESAKQAVARIKKYNKFVTDYRNLYNKYTGANGQQEIANFNKRVAKIKEQNQMREMFTTKIRNNDGELVDHEVKDGLYYKPDGKKFQKTEKGKPVLDAEGNPIWLGAYRKQLFNVVGRKVQADEKGRMIPTFQVETEDGTIQDFNLNDFRDLRKLSFSNKTTGEKFDEFLTDEERFMIKAKGKLVRYRYKSKQGEKAVDILGYPIYDTYGNAKIMYFDEETGEQSFTKSFHFKYNGGEGRVNAFVVAQVGEDRSQYLEILSDEDSEAHLTRVAQKRALNNAEKMVEKYSKKNEWIRDAELTALIDQTIDKNSDVLDAILKLSEAKDSLEELQKEVTDTSSKNDITKLVEELRDRIIALSKIETEQSALTLLNNNKAVTQFYEERLRSAKIKLDEARKRLDDKSKAYSKEDVDNMMSYEKDIKNLVNLILIDYSNANNKLYTIANDESLDFKNKAMDKFTNVIAKLYGTSNANMNEYVRQAVVDGYFDPDILVQAREGRLTDKQKRSVVQYIALQHPQDMSNIFTLDAKDETLNDFNTALQDLIATSLDYRDNKEQMSRAFLERISKSIQKTLNMEQYENLLNREKSDLDIQEVYNTEREILDELIKATTRNRTQEAEMKRGKYALRVRGNDVFTYGQHEKAGKDSALPSATVAGSGIKSISFSDKITKGFQNLSDKEKYEFVYTKFMENFSPSPAYEFQYMTSNVEGNGLIPFVYEGSGSDDTRNLLMVLRKSNGELVRVDSNGRESATGQYSVITRLSAATPLTNGGANRFREQNEIQQINDKIVGETNAEKLTELNLQKANLQQFVDLRIKELSEFRKQVFADVNAGKVVTSKILTKSNGIMRVDGKARSLQDIFNKTTDELIKLVEKGEIKIFTATSDKYNVGGTNFKVKVGRAYMTYNNKLYFLNTNKLSRFDAQDAVSGIESLLKGTRTFNEVLRKELSPIYWGRGLKKSIKEKDTITEIDEFSDERLDEIRAKSYHIRMDNDKLIYGNVNEVITDDAIKYVLGTDRMYDNKELTLSDIQNHTEAYQDFLDFLSDKYYNVNNSLLSGKEQSEVYLKKLFNNGFNANILPNSQIQFDSIYVQPDKATVGAVALNTKVSTPVTTTTTGGTSTPNVYTTEGFKKYKRTIKNVSTTDGGSGNVTTEEMMFPDGIEKATIEQLDRLTTQLVLDGDDLDRDKIVDADLKAFNDYLFKAEQLGIEYDVKGLVDFLNGYKNKLLTAATPTSTASIGEKPEQSINMFVDANRKKSDEEKAPYENLGLADLEQLQATAQDYMNVVLEDDALGEDSVFASTTYNGMSTLLLNIKKRVAELKANPVAPVVAPTSTIPTELSKEAIEKSLAEKAGVTQTPMSIVTKLEQDIDNLTTATDIEKQMLKVSVGNYKVDSITDANYKDLLAKDTDQNNGAFLFRADTLESERNQLNKEMEGYDKEYKQFLGSILSHVKDKVVGIDSIEFTDSQSKNPLIQAIKRTLDRVGYGQMLADAKTILLTKDRPIGTEYHEAFHAYEHFMLSDKARLNAYDRIRQLVGSTLSDKEASERLAEMYRAYSVKRKLEEQGKHTNFFKRLMDFIDRFFKGIYNLLEQDEINSSTRKVKSLNQLFSDVFEGKQYKQILDFNAQEHKELMDFMTITYNTRLQEEVGDMIRWFTDSRFRTAKMLDIVGGANDSTLVDRFYDYLYGKVGGTLRENSVLTYLGNDLARRNPQEFNRLLPVIKVRYNELVREHIAYTNGQVLYDEIEDGEEDGEEERSKDYTDTNATEINEKLNIKDFLKFVMSSIPQLDTRGSKVRGILKLDKPVEFAKLHDQVHKLLIDELNYNNMIHKLRNSSNSNINYGLVSAINMATLKASTPMSRVMLENAFFNQYSKQSVNYIGHIYRNKEVEIIDLNEQAVVNSVASNTKNNFAKLLADNPNNPKQLHLSLSEKLKGQDLLTQLEVLGFNISKEVYDKLSPESKGLIGNEMIEFETNGIKDLSKKANIDVYKQRGFLANGHVRNMAKVIGNELDSDFTFSGIYSLDNKRQYPIAQWNYVNKMVEQMKSEFPNAEVKTATDFKADERNKALKVSELSDKDLMVMSIINASKGIVPYIFSGDKSTYLGIGGITTYYNTVSDERKVALYKDILRDEMVQYAEFSGNSLNIEPNYFAISKALFDETTLNRFKVVEQDDLLNKIKEMRADTSLNNSILSYVRGRQDELDAFASQTGIDLEKYGITSEGITHFFADGLYKQTRHIVGDIGFYKDAADALKRLTGAMGNKATMRLDSDYINYYNEHLATGGMKFKETFRSVVVDDVLSTNLELASEFVKEEDQMKVKNMVAQYRKTGQMTTELMTALEGTPYGFKKGKGSINVADGSGFVHIDALRFQLISESKWSPDLEELYQKDLRTNISDKEKSRLVAQLVASTLSTKKPQYFGKQILDNGTESTAFYKTSIFPLTRTMGKQNKMVGSMMKMMEDKDLQFTFMESAVKIGRKKAINEIGDKQGSVLFDETGQLNNKVNNELVNTTYWQYWGTQLDIDDNIKTKQVIGTQMRKLIFGNLKDLLGADTANALFSRFNRNENLRIKLEQEDLQDRIGYGVDKVADRNKILEILTEEAKSRNVSNDFINQIRDLLTSDRGLDLASNRLKFESLLYSLVTNNVIKSKVNGTSQPQVSSLGVADIEYNVENGGIVQQTGEGMPELKFYSVDAKSDKYGMEIYLPSYFKGKVDIGELDPKLLQLIAFRIPTQGLNSIEKIIVKGFLPANQGNSIIVPKELTTKAGSDFDIDKLNIYIPASYKTSEGKHVYIKGYRSISESRNDYKEYLQQADFSMSGDARADEYNQFIESLSDKDVDFDLVNTKVGEYNEVALNYNMTPLMTFKQFQIKAINNNSIEIYISILNKPELRKLLLTPNTDDDIKKLAKDGEFSVRKLYNENKAIEFADLLTLPQQIKSKSSFIAGKETLGAMALHNTHHVLAQYADLVLNNASPIFLSSEPSVTVPLNRSKDSKGRWISEILSQFINATVDVAKDDYIKDINLSLNTAGVYGYLIRAGIPIERVVYFMSQPILREYSKMYSELTAVSGEENIKPFDMHNTIMKRLNNKFGETPMGIVKGDEDTLKGLIKNDRLTPLMSSSQKYILHEFSNYFQDAFKLSNLMNSTGFDTKSVGTNQSENDIRLENFRNTINSNKLNDKAGNSYFTTHTNDKGDLGSLAGMFYNTNGNPTFIKSMLDVVKTAKSYFKNLFTYNKGEYHKVLSNMSDLLQYMNTNDKIKMKNKMINELVSFVIQNNPSLKHNYEELTNVTADTIHRMQEQRKMIENKLLSSDINIVREANDELNKNPLLNNEFIRALNTSMVGDVKVIDFKNGNKMDVLTQEMMHKAFDELYLQRPDIAYGIILHNLFQSGFSNSPIQLSNGIPNRYILDVAKNYYNQPILNYANFRTMFILNNYSQLLKYHNPNDILSKDSYDSYYYNLRDKADNYVGTKIIIDGAGVFTLKDNTITGELKTKDGSFKKSIEVDSNGIYRTVYISPDETYEVQREVTLNNWFNKLKC